MPDAPNHAFRDFYEKFYGKLDFPPLMLYNNHIGEAKGIQKAFAAGAHARYLYLVQSP